MYFDSWTKDKVTLKDVTVDMRGNRLLMVVGSVGSGKVSHNFSSDLK